MRCKPAPARRNVESVEFSRELRGDVVAGDITLSFRFVLDPADERVFVFDVG